MIAYNVITPPVLEPVSLSYAKKYLRISEGFTDEDALIQMQITAARERFERGTGLVLAETVFDAVFDAWPSDNIIRLFKVPLISVDNIKYYDTEGTEQTINGEDLYVDNVSRPARITHPEGWFPVADTKRLGGIRVRFTAGFTTTDNMPKIIMNALLMMIAHFYENRTEVDTVTNPVEVPLAAEHVIEMFQIKEHR